MYVEAFVFLHLKDSLAAKSLRAPYSKLCENTQKARIYLVLPFLVNLSEYTVHLLFLMNSVSAVSLCAHSLDEKRVWSERVYINPPSLYL